MSITSWKVSKYGVISGPYFPVFEPEILRIWTLFTQCMVQTFAFVNRRHHDKISSVLQACISYIFYILLILYFNIFFKEIKFHALIISKLQEMCYFGKMKESTSIASFMFGGKSTPNLGFCKKP